MKSLLVASFVSTGLCFGVLSFGRAKMERPVAIADWREVAHGWAAHRPYWIMEADHKKPATESEARLEKWVSTTGIELIDEPEPISDKELHADLQEMAAYSRPVAFEFTSPKSHGLIVLGKETLARKLLYKVVAPGASKGYRGSL